MQRSSRRSRARRVVARLGTVPALAVLVVASAPATCTAEEWVWPVTGQIITPYANDNARPYAGGMHRGIDISASTGTSVIAAHAGQVTYAGALGSSGQVVAIETSEGRYVTSYLHLRVVAVRRGETVRAAQKLGEVGTSGQRSAAEPHLHFGVRVAAQEHVYVDPLTLLPPLAGGEPQASPVPAPAPAPLRADVAPVTAPRVAPVPVGGLPRARSRPVAAPRPPGLLPTPAGRPVSRSHTPEMHPTPAGAPARQGSGVDVPSVSEHLRAVPAGPGRARAAQARIAQPSAPRPVAAPIGSRSSNWGRVASLGGVVLVGLVLCRRARRSGPARREHAPQPPSRTAPVKAPAVASPAPVSQMS
jgi:peptidase M23-like protein